MSQLLFSYDGRIGIKQFWIGLLSGLASSLLLAVVVGIALGLALVLTGATPLQQEWASIAGAVVVSGYAVFTQLAVTAKRCHDQGRSGWWCLLTLIPFVGLLWLVFDLGARPGASTKSATG